MYLHRLLTTSLIASLVPRITQPLPHTNAYVRMYVYTYVRIYVSLVHLTSIPTIVCVHQVQEYIVGSDVLSLPPAVKCTTTYMGT